MGEQLDDAPCVQELDLCNFMTLAFTGLTPEGVGQGVHTIDGRRIGMHLIQISYTILLTTNRHIY